MADMKKKPYPTTNGNLAFDIQAQMAEGKTVGYEKWA